MFRHHLSIAVLSAALLAPLPLAASEPGFELSLVAAPSASYSDYDGFEFDTGLGLGLGWAFSERWSVELRGLWRESDRFGDFEQLDHQTFDLGLRRHFLPGSSWQPFLQAGASLQRAEVVREVVCTVPIVSPCPPEVEDRDDVGGFVGGGVDWNFSRRAALRFDGRLILLDSDAGGERVDATAGLVFRF